MHSTIIWGQRVSERPCGPYSRPVCGAFSYFSSVMAGFMPPSLLGPPHIIQAPEHPQTLHSFIVKGDPSSSVSFGRAKSTPRRRELYISVGIHSRSEYLLLR